MQTEVKNKLNHFKCQVLRNIIVNQNWFANTIYSLFLTLFIRLH